MDWTRLSHQKRGITIFRPSVACTLVSRAPASASAAAIGWIYEAFLRRFGHELSWYATGELTRMKSFGDDGARIVPTWSQAGGRDQRLSFRMYGGGTATEAKPPSFWVEQDGNEGLLHVALPVETLDQSPEDVVDFVTEAAARYPLRWGLAGFAMAWDYYVHDDLASETFGPWLTRYPGLSHGEPNDLACYPDDGITHVGWLTFLDKELVDRLGPDALASLEGIDGVSVTPVGDGVRIRIGERPRLGDRDRGDDLPTYRAVGRVLSKLRARGYYEHTGFEDGADSEAWAARFDGV